MSIFTKRISTREKTNFDNLRESIATDFAFKFGLCKQDGSVVEDGEHLKIADRRFNELNAKNRVYAKMIDIIKKHLGKNEITEEDIIRNLKKPEPLPPSKADKKELDFNFWNSSTPKNDEKEIDPWSQFKF